MLLLQDVGGKNQNTHPPLILVLAKEKWSYVLKLHHY